MLKILQSWTQVEGGGSYYTDLCPVERMRIEGEEWVDRWRPPPPFALPLPPPPPSYLSRFAGISIAEGGARLISCPEFRTSGNLHPWVHINCCEEELREGRGWRSCGEEGRRGGGHGTRRTEREREGERAKSPEFRAPFFDATPFFRFSLFSPPLSLSLSLCFFPTTEPASRIENAFQFGRPVIDCLYRGPRFWFTRTVFIESRGRWKGWFFLYIYTVSGGSAKQEEDRRKGRLISWTGNVGWKDGEW